MADYLPQNNPAAAPQGITPLSAAVANSGFQGDTGNPIRMPKVAPQVAAQPTATAPVSTQNAPQMPQNGPPQPVTASDGTPLDPGVLNVMAAIRQIESNGNYNAVGDNGSSMGAFQWNNGSKAVAPGQLPANFVSAAKQFGLDPTDFSQANQNHVAYMQIEALKNQGLTPIEVDAKWNGAKYDAATNTYTHINPQRAQLFTQALASVQSGIPQPSTNAPVDSSQQQQPASVGGFLGNAVGSAANLVGNIGNAVLHPIQTAQNLGSVAVGGVQELGGQQNQNTQNFDNVVNYFKQRYGGISNLEHTIYTDPVGFAADLSTVLGGAAGVAGAVGKGAELAGLGVRAGAEAGGIAGAASDVAGALSKASALTNPLTPVVKGAGALLQPAKNAAISGMGKLAGFNRATPTAILEDPAFFTPENIANVTRETISSQVADSFAAHQTSLSDSVAQYAPIIEDTTNRISVAKNWLEDNIRSIAKADVKDGQIIPTTRTTVRTSQLSGLQDILNQFKPAFQTGQLTNEEFINLRRQLDQVAYGASGIKDSKVAEVAAQMRGKLNADYRSSVPGLDSIDNGTSNEIATMNRLRKGFFDKKGQLLPGAESKIANAGNETKPTREGSDIARLEELVPGITRQIKALKAIEDIRKAGDIKVGAYTSAGLKTGEITGAAYGIATGNLAITAAGITAYILTQPGRAVAIIKAIDAVDPRLTTLVMARLAKYATTGAVASTATQGAVQPTGIANQSQSQQPIGSTGPTVVGTNTQLPGTQPQTQVGANAPSQSISVPSGNTNTQLEGLAQQAGYNPASISAALQHYSPQEIRAFLTQNQ